MLIVHNDIICNTKLLKTFRPKLGELLHIMEPYVLLTVVYLKNIYSYGKLLVV